MRFTRKHARARTVRARVDRVCARGPPAHSNRACARARTPHGRARSRARAARARSERARADPLSGEARAREYKPVAATLHSTFHSPHTRVWNISDEWRARAGARTCAPARAVSARASTETWNLQYMSVSEDSFEQISKATQYKTAMHNVWICFPESRASSVTRIQATLHICIRGLV